MPMSATLPEQPLDDHGDEDALDHDADDGLGAVASQDCRVSRPNCTKKTRPWIALRLICSASAPCWMVGMAPLSNVGRRKSTPLQPQHPIF